MNAQGNDPTKGSKKRKEKAPRYPHLEDEVRLEALDHHKRRLPLVIMPKRWNDHERLVQWVTERRWWLGEKLSTHGALLFRGFALDHFPQLDEVCKAISADDAASTRVWRDGSTLHGAPACSLMDDLLNPPRQIHLGALCVPPGPPQEATLVDFREVYQALDKGVVERFERKGLRVVRRYDIVDGVWGESDQGRIESKARQLGFEVVWEDATRARMTRNEEATRVHERNGTPVWFNVTQEVAGRLAAESAKERADRLSNPHTFLHGVASTAIGAIERRISAEASLEVTFGDGSPVPQTDLEHIAQAIAKHTVHLAWKDNDLLVIDNLACGHGHAPSLRRHMMARAVL